MARMRVIYKLFECYSNIRSSRLHRLNTEIYCLLLLYDIYIIHVIDWYNEQLFTSVSVASGRYLPLR